MPGGDLQRGVSEMLALGVLRDRPMYGYEIIRELRERSEGYFAMEEGLLYPVLHRLEREGLVHSQWRASEQGRRRRYYALTEAGRKALATGVIEWRTHLQKMLGIVDPAGGANRARA